MRARCTPSIFPRCNYFEILSAVVSPRDASAGLEHVALLNVAFPSRREPCNVRLGELQNEVGIE
jgi:hypothetical protein